MMTLSWRIHGGDYDAAGLATRKLKEQLARVGVDAAAMRRAMIAAYEAEMNVVIHARTGTLWARVDGGRLDLEISDEGPGIPDVDLAMREGWSTAPARAREMGFGAGLGLPNIRKNSDRFEIETRVGRGTRIRSTIVLRPGTEAPAAAPAFPLHADGARCRHCMRCVMACPTAALRVGPRGPFRVEELCVGCTACAGACEAGVYGTADGGSADGALVVPAEAVLVLPRGFLSGIPVTGGPARVLEALARLGFADVRLLEEWDEALHAAACTAARGRPPAGLPLIVPGCPAAAALVESRFPSLLPHLGAWLSPLEAAGEEFPLRPVVLVVSCPAQSAAAARGSLTDRLTVVSAARLAAALAPILAEPAGQGSHVTPLRVPDRRGAGEAMTVTGARHVARALAEAEAGQLPGVAVLDPALCDGGCAGSPYLSADSVLAEHRWRDFVAEAPRAAAPAIAPGAVTRARPWAPRPGVRLDPDMSRAIAKLSAIDALARTLPGRDCGACGAPTCAAFAEDAVLGRPTGGACPHLEVKA